MSNSLPVDCSTPDFAVLHHLPSSSSQTHVHWGGGAIQPSYPLSSFSPPAFSRSQPRGLFQGVKSSHQVAKVLELQLQHQSFQWIFRVDFLVWSPCCPRSLLQHHSSKALILWHSAFFIVQLLHLYKTPGKTIAWIIQTFVGKVKLWK